MKFATALDDVVLIEREGCDLLISPEDSEEFVNNMKVLFKFLLFLKMKRKRLIIGIFYKREWFANTMDSQKICEKRGVWGQFFLSPSADFIQLKFLSSIFHNQQKDGVKRTTIQRKFPTDTQTPSLPNDVLCCDCHLFLFGGDYLFILYNIILLLESEKPIHSLLLFFFFVFLHSWFSIFSQHKNVVPPTINTRDELVRSE